MTLLKWQTNECILCALVLFLTQRFIHEASCTDDQTNTRLWIGMSDIEQEGEWRWVDGRQVTAGSRWVKTTGDR